MSPEVTEKLAVYAIEPSGIMSEEFGAWVRADIKKFREAVGAAGLAPK